MSNNKKENQELFSKVCINEENKTNINWEVGI